MGSLILIIITIGLIAVVSVAVIMLSVSSRSASKNFRTHTAVSANLRSLVAAQRAENASLSGKPVNRSKRQSLAVAAATEADDNQLKQDTSLKVTLARQLQYAAWPITAVQYRGIQLAFTVALFIPVSIHFMLPIQFLVLFLSPLIVNAVLEYFVQRRFNQFDEDYPVLLMQYTSLLKTGMATLPGLEAAAKGLSEGSLVRQEVELLMERLRLGLTEDQAINALGEDIPHPEIELFVQSLLLSRRVGGTLSTTLERLARQVRKRQQFRHQAVAAVGMERSSLWMVALIMTLLLLYLGFNSPELIVGAFKNETGNMVFQSGIAMILIGFYWSRQVTKIKV